MEPMNFWWTFTSCFVAVDSVKQKLAFFNDDLKNADGHKNDDNLKNLDNIKD